MTLTEFLLARLDEDEARVEGFHQGDDPDFVWGPDRIRAECDAKRRIVVLHHPLDGGSPEMYPWTDDHGKTYWPECAECAEKHVAGRGCDTLRALALSYADHPDYREEWRPNG